MVPLANNDPPIPVRRLNVLPYARHTNTLACRGVYCRDGASICQHIVTTSRDLGTSAPYRHVNFLKIIAIKWKSSYTVGSVIDHFQQSSSQARLGLIIVENDLEPPTV